MKNFAMTGLMALFLMGCASSGDSPMSNVKEFNPRKSDQTRQCLNAHHNKRGFEVLSASQVEVDYGRHKYIVSTHQCDLTGTDRMSFSQGPERMTHLGHQRLYVTELRNGKICGGGLDRLVVRKTGEDFSMPGRSCVITSVQKIDK